MDGECYWAYQRFHWFYLLLHVNGFRNHRDIMFYLVNQKKQWKHSNGLQKLTRNPCHVELLQVLYGKVFTNLMFCFRTELVRFLTYSVLVQNGPGFWKLSWSWSGHMVSIRESLILTFEFSIGSCRKSRFDKRLVKKSDENHNGITLDYLVFMCFFLLWNRFIDDWNIDWF